MRLTSPRGLARRGAFVFSRARVSRLFWGAASIFGALWAVGCGGGGGSANPITPPPSVPPISPFAVEGNGTVNNPILLGNIYQLQFIGGTLSSVAVDQIEANFEAEGFSFDAAAAQSVAISDFGELEQRMTLHYKLTADLDLSAAAEWDEGKGFDPIGSHSAPFSGIFNGDGYVLRGLRIRRDDENGIGFFAYLGGGARVVSLGIADARVEGQMNVGALAGEVLAATVGAGLEEDARLEDVWAWGRVFGSNGSLTTGVGGLVGRLEGGQIVRGWFGGHVEDGDSTGGLVGFANADAGQRIEDSWAMAAVSGNNMLGGLLGGASEIVRLPPVIYRSWAAGPIYPMSSNPGLVGGLVGESSGAYSTDSFSGIETSGQSRAGDGGTAVDSILTLSVASWNPTVWNFGGDSNFPVLRAGDSDLQKVAMAYGLTRLSVGSGDLLSVFPIGVTMTINGDNEAILALDVNGLAANPGDAGDATPNTPIPDCRFFNDRMEAVTNYNGAKVRMWMVAANTVNAVLRAYSGGDECYARVIGSGEGILRVDFAVGAQRMTLDYPFEIEDGVTVNPPFGVSFSFPRSDSRFEVPSEGRTIRLIGLDATFAAMQTSIAGFTVSVADDGSNAFVKPILSVTAIFHTDNREVTLTLTAMDAVSQQATTLRAVLVSPPRAFPAVNSEARITAPVAGAVVLSAADVRISLWHLFGKSTIFSLADDAGDLFGVDPKSGRVSLARRLNDGENDRVYSLILQGRPDDNSVLGEQNIRVLLGNPPLEVVGDGSEDDPYIIDDIYELQAINGALPGGAVAELTTRLGKTATEVRALAATLFGAESERLEANYRLGADIDATPTRGGWDNNAGFDPIDGFTGVLDGCVTSACNGGVYVVRGLHINRMSGNNIGLFSQIIKGDSNELVVSNLGVEEANINGGGMSESSPEEPKTRVFGKFGRAAEWSETAIMSAA